MSTTHVNARSRTVAVTRVLGAWRRPALFGAAVAGACLMTAALTQRLPLVVMALLVVVTMTALWQLHPRLGLVALWATWLLIPGLRRIITVFMQGTELDPLAVVPFVATATIAVLEMVERPLPSRAGRIMATAFAGIAIGMPLGAKLPTALTFGLLAYGGAIFAFAIGYCEAMRSRGDSTLERTLQVLLPVLTVYGILQYTAGLNGWDARWVAESGLVSLAAPGDVGHYRIFSTLNSPGTFASVLTVALILMIARRRMGPVTIVS